MNRGGLAAQACGDHRIAQPRFASKTVTHKLQDAPRAAIVSAAGRQAGGFSTSACVAVPVCTTKNRESSYRQVRANVVLLHAGAGAARDDFAARQHDVVIGE